jgi:VWFA-related protein
MSLSRAGVPLLAVALAAHGLAAPETTAQQRDTRERRVVVSVLDRAGNPAAGLTPADFTVREDGIAREVIKVEQSTAPMQIAILVDTSAGMQISLRDVRLGIATFARSVWSRNPDSDITLMEFGERPRVLIPATARAETLKNGIDALFEHPGSGAYLQDAVVDAARTLKSRAAPRPVIVVFSRESSPEFSTRQSGPVEAAIKDTNAQLWSLILREGSPAASDEAVQRDVVLGDVASRSGGARETVLDRMGIEPGFARLGDRLAAQYVVTYGRPESLIPPTKLEVTGKRADTRVLAPRWTGQ